MLLHIIARGKIGRSPEAELVARYEKRIAWPFKHSELPETGGKSPDPLTPTRTVLLDERGKHLTSDEFAAVLGRWRDEGRDAAFVIGGADGIDPELRGRATTLLSFGAMVWPHMLVRVMLAEQLYRAATILSGGPYHRA